MRKKTSIVWTISKEDLQSIMNDSCGFMEVLRKLGIYSSGSTWKMLKKRVLEDSLSIEKMRSNKRVGHPNKNEIELKDILIKDSSYSNRGNLKRRLIRNGILKNECSICHMENKWNGKDLIMILDHINGVYNDNRIKNLRLICPNCNSQTETFAGRNQKKQKKCIDCGTEVMRALRCRKCYCKNRIRQKKNTCIDCGKLISNYSTRCMSCNRINVGKNRKLIRIKNNTCVDCGVAITEVSTRCKKCSAIKNNIRKVKERPSKESLKIMIDTMPMTHIGKKYGVSDNTIRKWARSYDLKY